LKILGHEPPKVSQSSAKSSESLDRIMTISLDFGHVEQRFTLIVAHAMMVSVGPANDLKSTTLEQPLGRAELRGSTTRWKRNHSSLAVATDSLRL
jgi:hypothetical protein